MGAYTDPKKGWAISCTIFRFRLVIILLAEILWDVQLIRPLLGRTVDPDIQSESSLKLEIEFMLWGPLLCFLGVRDLLLLSFP